MAVRQNLNHDITDHVTPNYSLLNSFFEENFSRVALDEEDEVDGFDLDEDSLTDMEDEEEV